MQLQCKGPQTAGSSACLDVGAEIKNSTMEANTRSERFSGERVSWCAVPTVLVSGGFEDDHEVSAFGAHVKLCMIFPVEVEGRHAQCTLPGQYHP
jgi:hypothetical protein